MENLFITWHYTTHGIAYMKNILAAFYVGKCSIKNNPIRVDNLIQLELNDAFELNIENGFLFDKIYYLISPQESFDKIASRRFYYRQSTFDDEVIKTAGTLELWKEVLELDFAEFDDCMDRELGYVSEKYPEKKELFCSQLWRDMQHYSISSQIKWFKEMSNAKEKYADKIEVVNIGINDFRDAEEIAQNLSEWIKNIKRKKPDANFFINVSLGSNETQVVWHILSEKNYLPQNTRLLRTYDDKSDLKHKRFKNFEINEISSKLINNVSLKISVLEKTKSPDRKLANEKMETFINMGFSILILGERGTGKSKLAKKYDKKDKAKPFIHVNCASFSDDNMAESALFGYIKGAFTGADKDTKGYFQNAHNGILFLDEVHHLSPRVQAKMLSVLNVEIKNKEKGYSVYKLQSSDPDFVQCKLIFASNLPVAKLKKVLALDFYDRIAQLVVEYPALRDVPEDREDEWKSVWENLEFENAPDVPMDKKLINWIKEQKLPGNFRDLEHIARNYRAFTQFSNEAKKYIIHKNPIDYTISEYERLYNVPGDSNKYNFSIEKSIKQLEIEFHEELVNWALSKFDNLKEVEKHFNEIGKTDGSTITYRTLMKWKNGK